WTSTMPNRLPIDEDGKPIPSTFKPAVRGKSISGAPAARPIVSGPAYASPEAAAQAWFEAYKKDGFEGHMRTTFDDSEVVSKENIKKTLDERYSELTEGDELAVLEKIIREPFAAVVCRAGERIDFVCLCHS